MAEPVHKGVHVYAFTDLEAMNRHMRSREGKKIIFRHTERRNHMETTTETPDEPTPAPQPVPQPPPPPSNGD